MMTAQAPSNVAPADTEMPSAAANSLVQLMTRAAAGDKRAWDALVERFAPLIWSVCRKYRVGYADAEDVGQNVWLQLVGHLDKIRDPAALPGWLVTVTRRECLRVTGPAKVPQAAGYVLDAEILADEHSDTAEQELLAAERHAALREAFAVLPPPGQRLIALLLQDPPVSYAEISARLDIPVGSIGPTRRRYLDKLRSYPAVAALISVSS
jgi:RNA polymerase sigma factor (sigma-70 family)